MAMSTSVSSIAGTLLELPRARHAAEQAIACAPLNARSDAASRPGSARLDDVREQRPGDRGSMDAIETSPPAVLGAECGARATCTATVDEAPRGPRSQSAGIRATPQGRRLAPEAKVVASNGSAHPDALVATRRRQLPTGLLGSPPPERSPTGRRCARRRVVVRTQPRRRLTGRRLDAAFRDAGRPTKSNSG